MSPIHRLTIHYKESYKSLDGRKPYEREHGDKASTRVLDGERASRAAGLADAAGGRYLPEYRAVREKAGGFLDLCFTPELAAEVTLQPVRRFGFDAAILFSDILVVPLALGRKVWFVDGEGPRLEPLTDAKALMSAARRTSMTTCWRRSTRPCGGSKPSSTPKTALIGFCGAPWTVATYMVAGHGTPDQAPARMFADRRIRRHSSI